MPIAWLLTAAGANRVYRANRGYADDPERTYPYTNAVQNHRRLKQGHLVLIHDKRRLLGLARIAEIRQSNGLRDQNRCPECDVARLRPLKRTPHGFKCDNGHWFAEPAKRQVPTTFFEADFGETYVPARDDIPMRVLFGACSKHNPRVAMHPVEITAIANRLIIAVPGASRLLDGDYLDEGDAAEELTGELDPDDPYIPGARDTRQQVMRTIRLRRGQHEFRKRLRDRYGDRCMVSGCTVMHAVEAAHISPYRGPNDHHPGNGLLLRADLHTLFDLDLIGIDPETMRVVVHPVVRVGEYVDYHDTPLRCSQELRPSASALALRWQVFNSRDARRADVRLESWAAVRA